MRARVLRRVLVVMAVVASIALTAHTQDEVPVHELSARFDASGVPHLDATVADVIDDRWRERLRSGLLERIRTGILALERGASEPFASRERWCWIRYDLWQRSYRFTPIAEAGAATETLERERDLLERALDLHDVTVGEPEDWADRRGAPVVFEVHLDLDPAYSNELERIRDWLSDPDGDRTHDDAFFGGVVARLAVYRTVAPRPEHSITFRSREVAVP